MVDGVRAAHDRGIRTGLVSNSWGTRRYDRATSSPSSSTASSSPARWASASPTRAIYELGAQRVGAAPAACVFVDDLAVNLDPARELGMAVVHHTAAASTLAELERLLA